MIKNFSLNSCKIYSILDRKIVPNGQQQHFEQQHLQLVILAQDSGVPSRIAIKMIPIGLDLTSWSGTIPQFPVPIYHKFVPENTAPGSELFACHAVDQMGNQEWKYSLEIGTGQNEVVKFYERHLSS